MDFPSYEQYRLHGGTVDMPRYLFLARRAWQYMKYITRGQATTQEALENDKDIINCFVELVSVYDRIDQIDSKAANGEDVTSETVGSYSVHYADSNTKRAEYKAEINEVCRRWLFAYLYRGVSYV